MASIDSYARMLALAMKDDLEDMESELMEKVAGLSYKGLVNSIEALETRTIENGHIYRSAFNGTYNGTQVNIGDLFIGLVNEEGSKWEVCPSGDDEVVYVTDTIEIQGGTATQ